MKISYDGRLWDFELEEMSVRECEAVEKYVGKGLGEWANQMGAGSVKAIVALWWVLRSQAGEDPGPVVTVPDGFRPVKLLAAFHAADEAGPAAAQPEEAEADPTTTAAGSPEDAPAAAPPPSLPG